MSKMRPTRRAVLASALGAGALWLMPGLARAASGDGLSLGAPEPFSFERLKAQAEALARRPHAPAPIADADLLEEIGYDLHNQVRFRPERTLWADGDGGTPVRFFHPGRFFKEPVRMFAVQDGTAREISFAPDYFDAPEGHPAHKLTDAAGFAGFRVMDGDQARDWMAFLGASYFRTSGPFEQFGLSARGLAVDSGLATPEEFPRFSRFWLEPDAEGGLVAHALLEGPLVTGAYRIASRRADGVVQDVEAALFVRDDIERLGIAPLTSMFWYGASNRRMGPDWRPQVHDSEGLSLWTGAGERIWRPLNNPPHVTVNSFLDLDPKGFGLMQRDRNFENYQDDGVFYERRASLWVEPLDGWGEGAVQLLEIPTDDEIHDNIGAFWNPAEPAAAGARFDLRYRLHWLADEPYPPRIARVVATRTGVGGIPGQPRPPGLTKFVVDFEGPSLDGLTRESGVKAALTASAGDLGAAHAYPVVGTGRWRAMFDLAARGDDPVELRLYLRRGQDALSETWLYQWFPSQAPRA